MKQKTKPILIALLAALAVPCALAGTTSRQVTSKAPALVQGDRVEILDFGVVQESDLEYLLLPNPERYPLIVGRIVLPDSACDDMDDCSRALKDACAITGQKKVKKMEFDAEEGVCRGTCSGVVIRLVEALCITIPEK